MQSDRRSPSVGSNRSGHSRSGSQGGHSLMGYDSGRIAAEDEYIRRELAETTSFCNAFWGNGERGFEAIQSRLKSANRTLDELRIIYKERADIENEYSRRMAKLAKSTLGRDETGGMKQALDTLRSEIEFTARSHADLAAAMKKELEGAVVDFQARVQNARKNSIAAIEKLHKHKQTQETYVNKSRERYEQDCIKINGYTAQSSLVQGRDLDKINSKLDKAQSTVSGNEKDYQNFVRALKDTTMKWNQEWKGFLDQTQDAEEERLDFLKSNMWNYANAVSAICVTDDESCERIRVSLESTETLRDIQHFIQNRGTGTHIPDPPDYVNYARGQAPPPRATYQMANFQRSTSRPAHLPGVAPQSLPPSQQPLPPQQPPPQQPPPQQPPPQQPLTQTQPPPGWGQHADQQQQQQNQQGGYRPPPGSVALPGMTQNGNAGMGHSDSAGSVNGGDGLDRSTSAKNFMARTPSLSQRQPPPPQQQQQQGGSGGPGAGAGSEPEDPIAKALANLRMRQGGAKSPAPGGAASNAGSVRGADNIPPPPSKSPVPGGGGSMRSAYSPQQPGGGAPSAAFMQAPERAASPLPVEQVVGQYGQAFPGERKSISRQNSTASAAPPPDRARSPRPSESGGPGPGQPGFAGVGARGRSPSPNPYQQQQGGSSVGHQQRPSQGQHTPSASQQQPGRPSTPLGISLDASGSVTHDQLAEQYRRQQAAAPPAQQQQQPQHFGQQQVPGGMPNPYQQQQQQQQAWQGGGAAPSMQNPYATPVSPGPGQPQHFPPSNASMAGSMGRTPSGNPYHPASAAYAGQPPPQQQQAAVQPIFTNPYGAPSPTGPPGPAGAIPGPAGAPFDPHALDQEPVSPTAKAPETPAEAYMHEYQRQHNMAVNQAEINQAGAMFGQHPPTGQYSDGGKPILFYVKALYDYSATTAEEFSFTAGDIIAVTHTEADGWWQGELLDEARRRPEANTFPSNFVVLLM